MKILASVLILFILTACSAQPAAPTVTLTPAATATLTPFPTVTPTPEPSPELLAMQEQISGNPDLADYVFHPEDGTLEYKGVKYEGLTYTGEQWELTLPDGTKVLLDKDKVKYGANGVDVAGYDYDDKNGWGVEVVNNMEKYDIIFTDAHEMSVAGVEITGATSVDATVRVFGLRELTIDPNTLDDLSARALHNFFVPGGTDNNAEATAWMKECKAGAPAMRTENVYTTTGGIQSENLTMVMDCGQEIPAGAVPIKGVELVYGKWFEREQTNNGGIYSANPKMPWLSIIFKKSGILSGLMVDKDSGVLKIFVGMSFNTREDILTSQASAITEIAMDWLSGYPEDLSLSSGTSQDNRARSWSNSVRIK